MDPYLENPELWPDVHDGLIAATKADLIPFRVRDPIPTFPLPLRRGEDEPAVDLGKILHALYHRASYDLRIDYEREPVPPLTPADSEWARDLIRERGATSSGQPVG